MFKSCDSGASIKFAKKSLSTSDLQMETITEQYKSFVNLLPKLYTLHLYMLQSTHNHRTSSCIPTYKNVFLQICRDTQAGESIQFKSKHNVANILHVPPLNNNINNVVVNTAFII
jgi:hypothetical protein